MLIAAKGCLSVISRTERPSELRLSALNDSIEPIYIMITMIPALITESENPVSAMKNKVNAHEAAAQYFFLIPEPESRENTAPDHSAR